VTYDAIVSFEGVREQSDLGRVFDIPRINVGKRTTNARFQLNCVDEVLELIKSLP